MIELWEKIKEEKVYDGFRKIIRRSFKLPDGKVEDFDVRLEGKVACIFGITTDNKVVLAREFRPGQEKILDELPGGAVEKDEDPLEAAKREFLEETGYTGEFKLIGTSWDDAYSTRYRYHFVATNCHKVAEPNGDETEFCEPVLLSIDEFKKHIQSGELTDSETALRGLVYLGLI